MINHRSKRDTMSLEEAKISSMWEIAEIGEVLEHKRLCCKQDLLDILTELRKKNPRSTAQETAFPESLLRTDTANELIDNMVALLKHRRSTSHQSLNL